MLVIVQSFSNDNLDVFQTRRLRFHHKFNPNNEKLHRIACLSNASVLWISQSKFDNFVFDLEIIINGYNILLFERNRNGGGIACSVRNDVSSTKEIFFPQEVETIFIEIFLSKTKPLAVGVIFCPLSQISFSKTLPEISDTIKKETYTLSIFTINVYLNNKYIFAKCWTTVSSIISKHIFRYQGFCNFFSLKRLISCPGRISYSISTIIYHTLASYSVNVCQKGIINITTADYQPIFGTRKTLRNKTESHK